jgi:hypothetical protein
MNSNLYYLLSKKLNFFWIILNRFILDLFNKKLKTNLNQNPKKTHQTQSKSVWLIVVVNFSNKTLLQ